VVLGSSLVIDKNTEFQSLRNGKLTFLQVLDQIIDFILADTNCSYRIAVGTDSHVGTKTSVVSCIHVHRIGRGAIGFLHKFEIERPVTNLREKIYIETTASLQLAYLFDDECMERIRKALNSGGHGKGISFEFHIDIGTRGQTKSLINEMVGMVKGLNFIPKIKPDSYCASCFADRYTKAM